MITTEDRHKISKLLHIKYPLAAEIYRSQIEPEKIYNIHYFWIVKFRSFLNYPWQDLLVCMIKDEEDYYGILIYNDSANIDSEFSMVASIQLADWADPVANCFHNIDLMIDEPPGSIFGGDISYSLMLSSVSVTTNIDIRPSMQIRSNINNISSEIANTVRMIINLYGDEYIKELLLVSRQIKLDKNRA